MWMLRGLAIWFTRHTPSDWEFTQDSGLRKKAGECSSRWSQCGIGLARFAAVAFVSWTLGRFPEAEEKQIFLGYDDDNHRVFIPMKHLFLVGANESGKTTTIRRILREIAKIHKGLDEGMGSVTIDGKGDPDLKRALKLFAEMMDVRFWDWSPRGTLKYDFLAHGGSTELVDRALSADTYGDPYFLRLAQRFLGFAVRALIAAGEPPTLKKLAHFIIPSNLTELGAQMEKLEMGRWGEFGEMVPELKGRELEAVHGTHHRLSVLAESDMGPLLEPGADGEETLNLLEAVRNREIVYFDLHASANRETARMLGAVIIIDLMTVFATLQYSTEEDPETGEERPEYHPTMVILDDIQAFASEAGIAGIASLYARARSVGAMMILGTQSFADLQVGHSENLIESILDNIRTLIVHRLPGVASRKKASEAFGKFEERRVRARVDHRGRPEGGGSMEVTEVPYVPETHFKRLGNGCAYVDVVDGEGPRQTGVEMP
jgi:hypothetical protein